MGRSAAQSLQLQSMATPSSVSVGKSPRKNTHKTSKAESQRCGATEKKWKTSEFVKNCIFCPYTVFPRIQAGVSISFVGFFTRPLNEAGLYSREASNSRTRCAPISIIRAVMPCSHSFHVHAILPRSSFYCSMAN